MADPTYSNPTDSATIISNAQAKATQAYNNARLQHDNDQLAFDKAKEAFNEEITKAGLTGYYQGQATQPALTNWAQMFGTWGAPTQGQQTMAGQQQGFTQAQDLAAMYGQYYAPGQTPTAGTTTQAAQQQAYNQWLDTQKQLLAQQTQQQTTAQNYLTMMAGLRGPADWIQYQKVLGATPQGLQSLAAAAAGQYVPGGGATTGVQPQSVSLPGFINSATGGAFGAQGGGASQAYQQLQQQGQPQGYQTQQYIPPQGGQQAWQGGQYGQLDPAAMRAQYNQQQSAGVNYAQDPNQQYQHLDSMPQGQTQQYGAWQQPQGQQYQTQQYQQPMGSNAQQTQAFQNSLVAPNQMAPQTWSNLTPSQQQMLLGTWESQGYTQDDAKALFSQSLPKYGGMTSAGQFRLQ